MSASTKSPVLAVVQVSAMFPPGVSRTVLLEMHEDGTVTWREVRRNK